jgi:hypothetical protein
LVQILQEAEACDLVADLNEGKSISEVVVAGLRGPEGKPKGGGR